MPRTTITIPENILVALRTYMAVHERPLREQSKVVEDALIRFFTKHDIKIDDRGDTNLKFSVQGEGTQKISVSIRASILKSLHMYLAYKGLSQHDQSKVTVLALQEYLEDNKIPIDKKNLKVLKFDVIREEYA